MLSCFERFGCVVWRGAWVVLFGEVRLFCLERWVVLFGEVRLCCLERLGCVV